MNYLQSDLYCRVNRGCPISVDMHEVDNFVELVFGGHRIGSDNVRLILDHTDTCTRVMAALSEARDKLAAHAHSQKEHNPATSPSDTKQNTQLAS